jgi:hypothetical protein
MTSTTTNAPAPPRPPTTDEVRAWLDYATDALQARRDEVVNALEMTYDAHPQVADDETAEVVTDNVSMATAWLKKAEETRKAEKEPFLKGGQEVDAFFRRLAAPLGAPGGIVEKVRSSLAAFHSRKIEAERLAREAAAREAERLAQDAAEKAAQAAKTGDGMAALAEAAEAAQQADRAAQEALAKPSTIVQSRGMYGGVASMAETWDFGIVNRAEALTWWLSQVTIAEVQDLIAPKVRAAMDRDPKTGEPRAVIPGIQWVRKQTLRVR